LKEPQLRADLSSEIENLQFGNQSWDTIALKTIKIYDKVLSNGFFP
jgi:hypothetical protein